MGHGAVVVPGGDPLREYTLEEKRLLNENLFRLVRRVEEGRFSDRQLNTELLQQLHHDIFSQVREHAGRIRGPGQGSEHLTFGPNYSLPRDGVPVALEKLFEQVRMVVAALERDPVDPDYDAAAFRVAVQTHAEVIRIHPFEDGSGRVSRALMGVILVRLGLRSFILGAPKEEYNERLNRYFRSGDFEPMMDFCARLYEESL